MQRSSRSRHKNSTQAAQFGEVKFRQSSALKTAADCSRTSSSSVEENSFALGFRHSSPTVARGVPIQKFNDREVSNQMEVRHSSPGLVARLMGLDSLPPQVAHKQKKDTKNSYKVATSEGGNPERNLQPRRTDDEKLFKDVFEVTEASNVRKQKVQSTRTNKISSKRSDFDINLIRQKFADAKRLSTNEVLRNSKEFDDALDILDSNKDLLMEFLQDPNSLLGKHLQDRNHVTENLPRSQITLLKSSKRAKCRNNEAWSKFVNHSESCPQPQNFRKPAINCPQPQNVRKTARNSSQLLKEHNQSLPCKSSVLQGGKYDCVHSTGIVVLKPNLEKAQKMSSVDSEKVDNFHYESRKCKESIVSKGGQKSHMEGRERPKLVDNAKCLDNKTRVSREIVRQVAPQMNQVISRHPEEVISSQFNQHITNDVSGKISHFNGFNLSETPSQLLYHFNEWNEGLCSPSLHSTESVTRRGAGQQLFERWKTTPCFQEVGIEAKGSNTLADILTSRNRQTRIPAETSALKIISDDKLRNEVFDSWDCPLGISSKNGWKDEISRTMPRSKSLPSSSNDLEIPRINNSKQYGGSENCCTLREVLDMDPDDFFDSNFIKWERPPLLRRSRYSTNKPQKIHAVSENMLPEREIHENSEELRKSIHVRHLSEEMPCTALSAENVIDVASISIPEDGTHPSVSNDEQIKQHIFQRPSERGELSADNNGDTETEETSTPHSMDCFLAQKERINLSIALSANELEQPSPVSVLEPQLEEESSNTGCFDRISADLQELRMQLNLLKLDSTDRYPEDHMGVSLSNYEDYESESQIAIPVADTPPAFRNEDERDFSYLLDILIDSGISCDDQNRFSGLCYSKNCQVDPHVFDKLEKKYAKMASWSSCERKFLFDLITCTLAGLETPCMAINWQPNSKRYMHMREQDGFVEGLWQMVVKQRKDTCSITVDEILDPRWLALEENFEEIDREMERLLNDDLLQEIVNDYI